MKAVLKLFFYDKNILAKLESEIDKKASFEKLSQDISSATSSPIKKIARILSLHKFQTEEARNYLVDCLYSKETVVRQYASLVICNSNWLIERLEEEKLLIAVFETLLHTEVLGCLAGFKKVSIVSGFESEILNELLLKEEKQRKYLNSSIMFWERKPFATPIFHFSKDEEALRGFLKEESDYKIGLALGFPKEQALAYSKKEEHQKKGELTQIFPSFDVEVFKGHFSNYDGGVDQGTIELREKGEKAVALYKKFAAEGLSSLEIINEFERKKELK